MSVERVGDSVAVKAADFNKFPFMEACCRSTDNIFKLKRLQIGTGATGEAVDRNEAAESSASKQYAR